MRIGEHTVTREMSGDKSQAVVKLNGVIVGSFQTPEVPFGQVGLRSHEFKSRLVRALRDTTEPEETP